MNDVLIKIQDLSQFLKQSSSLLGGESLRIMRTLMRKNSGSYRMVCFLTLLMSPWHGSMKSLGSISLAAKLKWNGHLTCLTWTQPTKFSSSGVSSRTISTRATLTPLLHWRQPSLRRFKRSPRRYVHMLSTTLPSTE